MSLGVVCMSFVDKVISQYRRCGKLMTKKSAYIICQCESLADGANTWDFCCFILFFYKGLLILGEQLRVRLRAECCQSQPLTARLWYE